MKKKLGKLLLMGLIFSVLVGVIPVTTCNTEDPKPWASEHIQLL